MPVICSHMDVQVGAGCYLVKGVNTMVNDPVYTSFRKRRPITTTTTTTTRKSSPTTKATTEATTRQQFWWEKVRARKKK